MTLSLLLGEELSSSSLVATVEDNLLITFSMETGEQDEHVWRLLVKHIDWSIVPIRLTTSEPWQILKRKQSTRQEILCDDYDQG